MAKLEVGAGFFADLPAVPLATADGDLIVANSRLIRLKVENGRENFIGDFEFNDQGLPTGTIRQYRFVSGGDAVYTITDADIDVLQLREIAGADDQETFLKLIFRDDDHLIGADLDDRMAGYAGNDRLEGARGDDGLKGMNGNDIIEGGAGNDVLHGASGSDVLAGGTGEDRLNGGKDWDTLMGGGGDDTFVFRSRGISDAIMDFAVGDRIALGFSGLGSGGVLRPAFFHLGAEAENRNQHILYDSDSGWLIYAEQGSASSHLHKFAWIGTGLDHLGAEDFVVI